MDLNTTREMWGKGSYAIVGDWFAEDSRACLDGLDLRGARLLDVACGTGAVAIEAARRGAAVTGLDLTPSMLVEAQRRAVAAGVDVRWSEGSFTDLSAHRGYDVATSAFGVIFAEDQAAVMAEVLRCLRPGGTAAIAAWAPGGVFGFSAPGLLDLLPAIAEGPDRTRWSTAEGLAVILEEAAVDHSDVQGVVDTVHTTTIDLPFASVDDAVAQMRRWSGPWIMLFDALAAMGQVHAGHAALIDHVAGFAEPIDYGVCVEVSYAVAHVRRLAVQ